MWDWEKFISKRMNKNKGKKRYDMNVRERSLLNVYVNISRISKVIFLVDRATRNVVLYKI